MPNFLTHLDLDSLPSPCFVVDTAAIERNLQALNAVQKRSGASVLLALKGFAMWSLAPLIRTYLPGTCASGLHEAMLGREVFGGEVHVYAPAFHDHEFDEIASLSDHLTFNSPSQWERFRQGIHDKPASKRPRCGLRINPEHREVEVELYDPCAPNSRLGMTSAQLDKAIDADPRFLEGITGLHFHTLCELNSDALERTLEAVIERFGRHLPAMQWVNMGGGHHITREDYDVDKLNAIIMSFANRFGVKVYLEPGEAVALNTGVLVSTVLDIVHNNMDIAILGCSATAHMPDVLEMPYRPDLIALPSGGQVGYRPEESRTRHTYRLGGLSCLAGDVIGDYAFDQPLKVGDRLIFADMAHYSMVKTTNFNGVPLPSIATHNSQTGETNVVKTFGYETYRDRLS